MKQAAVEDLQVAPRIREILAGFLRDAHAASGPRLRQVILYGSTARGQARPDSDIDLLVEWQGPEAQARDILVPITTDIFLASGVDLSIHVVSPDRWQRMSDLQTAFRENIEREGFAVAG